MKGITNKIFQVIVDIIIGFAIYFGITSFIPVVPTNLAVVITLVITAVFAEFIEARLKK